MSSENEHALHESDAWRVDWQARLQTRLEERGQSCLTDFVRAQPAATLLAIADQLGRDIAPVQLQWVLIEEAKNSDDVRRCAVDLLCRKLNEVQGGWPPSRDWNDQEDVTFALTAWKVSLRGLGYDDALENIITMLLDELDISPGWIPLSADDQTLTVAFDKHWPR